MADFDPDAFLAQGGTATEDFNPDALVGNEFDPDKFLKGSDTPATQAAVSSGAGLSEFNRGLNLASVPLDAAKMLGQIAIGPLPGAYHQLHQAYDLLRGQSVEQAIPESQTLKRLEDIKAKYGGGSPQYREAAGAAAQEILPQVALLGVGGRTGGELPAKGGEINASEITSPESVPAPEVRQGVGGEAPLREQGQVAPARTEVPQETVVPETARVPAQAPAGAGEAVAPSTRELNTKPWNVDATDLGYTKWTDKETGYGASAPRVYAEKGGDVFEFDPNFNMWQKADFSAEDLPKIANKVEGEPTNTVLQAQPEQPVQGGGEQPTAPEIPPEDRVYAGLSDEPYVSAVANKFVQERAARGEIGEVAPGQGYSSVDLAQRGLQMEPEEISQHVSDLMQGRGDAVVQGAAVRAEEARLSQRSADLSRVSDANPNDINSKIAADNAMKDVTDFHNGPVARLKTIFHGVGEGLQGEIPVDLSTTNGLREKWLKDTGALPDAKWEPTIRRVVKKVSDSNGEYAKARSDVMDKVEAVTSRRRLPTAEDVARNIADRMKSEPCLI